MGFAFGISEDDIIAVAERNGVEIDDAVASKWIVLLDMKKVENAALMGHDLEDQTEGAYIEIERQLDDLGYWGQKNAERDANLLNSETPSIATISPRRRV